MRDIGSVVISVVGLLIVVKHILVKSRRMFAAVGKVSSSSSSLFERSIG